MQEQALWNAVVALAIEDAHGAFKTNLNLERQEELFFKQLRKYKDKGRPLKSSPVLRIVDPESVPDERGKFVRDARNYFTQNGDFYKDLTITCERANICPKRLRNVMIEKIDDIKAREARLYKFYKTM
jgi:hypothetical protein